MKFSMINVTKIRDNCVDGHWIQDKIGTLEDVIKCAISTNKVNSDRLTIAITDQVINTTPALDYFRGLKPMYILFKKENTND